MVSLPLFSSLFVLTFFGEQICRQCRLRGDPCVFKPGKTTRRGACEACNKRKVKCEVDQNGQQEAKCNTEDMDTETTSDAEIEGSKGDLTPTSTPEPVSSTRKRKASTTDKNPVKRKKVSTDTEVIDVDASPTTTANPSTSTSAAALSKRQVIDCVLVPSPKSLGLSTRTAFHPGSTSSGEGTMPAVLMRLNSLEGSVTGQTGGLQRVSDEVAALRRGQTAMIGGVLEALRSIRALGDPQAMDPLIAALENVVKTDGDPVEPESTN